MKPILSFCTILQIYLIIDDVPCGVAITDIPGKPNAKNGTCTGKCLEETNESLNDRG